MHYREQHKWQFGNTKADRKAVFDLYCENEKGEKFIIELQNARQDFFKDRSIYYATFPIQSQAIKGKDAEGRSWNYHLKAVYTIGILNFSFPDKKENRYIREIQLMDKQTYEVFYEKLTFIYLEMNRFKKGEDELDTRFDQWMYLLKNLYRLQEIPVRLQEKIFNKVFEQAEIAKLTKEEMRAYEESQKAYWDNYSIIETAKNEGRQEGKQAGRQLGVKENRIATAREMKKDGHPIEMISKYTSLTKEQIEKL